MLAWSVANGRKLPTMTHCGKLVTNHLKPFFPKNDAQTDDSLSSPLCVVVAFVRRWQLEGHNARWTGVGTGRGVSAKPWKRQFSDRLKVQKHWVH